MELKLSVEIEDRARMTVEIVDRRAYYQFSTEDTVDSGSVRLVEDPINQIIDILSEKRSSENNDKLPADTFLSLEIYENKQVYRYETNDIAVGRFNEMMSAIGKSSEHLGLIECFKV